MASKPFVRARKSSSRSWPARKDPKPTKCSTCARADLGLVGDIGGGGKPKSQGFWGLGLGFLSFGLFYVKAFFATRFAGCENPEALAFAAGTITVVQSCFLGFAC